MAEFTVRMVLHDNATWEDYKTLAANLAAQQILDTITGDSGGVYRLPGGEYQCFGDLTIEEVRTIAANSATPIGKRFAVFVTQSVGRAWQGLERIG
jgi:hypothetical protein